MLTLQGETYLFIASIRSFLELGVIQKIEHTECRRVRHSRSVREVV